MKAIFINPFLKSTMDSINTISDISVKPDKAYITNENFPSEKINIFSSINGRTQNYYNGSVVISFSEDSILEIVSKMLDRKYEKIDEDVKNALNELTQMICSSAVRTLKDNGYAFDISRPAFFNKKANHMLKKDIKTPRIGIPFKTSSGSVFKVEISFDR